MPSNDTHHVVINMLQRVGRLPEGFVYSSFLKNVIIELLFVCFPSCTQLQVLRSQVFPAHTKVLKRTQPWGEER